MINSKKELMQYLKYIKFTGECELHNFIFYRGKYFKFKIEPIVYKNKILSQVDYSTLEPNKCYISEIKIKDKKFIKIIKELCKLIKEDDKSDTLYISN